MDMLQQLLDPERRAKAAKDQAELKQVMGHRVARRPGQANYLFGVARERMALNQLTVVGNLDDESRDALLSQLAEGLALQAKFEAAAQVAPEGDHKQEYFAKAEAIARVNEQQCACPVLQDAGDGGKEATQLSSEKAWNGKLTISFTRCKICKAISAYA